MLLAPTVNISSSHPLAGRNFECYSEDPYLTARLAVEYISGVQSTGVGCSVKHFVANDSEFERMTISSEVDARTLREISLVPFEAAVLEAGTWSSDGGLQQTARHVLQRTSVAERTPQAGVGFRRRHHVGLVRNPQHGPRRDRRARSRNARTGAMVRDPARRRGTGRRRHRSGPGRQGPGASWSSSTGPAASPHPTSVPNCRSTTPRIGWLHAGPPRESFVLLANRDDLLPLPADPSSTLAVGGDPLSGSRRDRSQRRRRHDSRRRKCPRLSPFKPIAPLDGLRARFGARSNRA